MGGMEPETSRETRGRAKTKINAVCSDAKEKSQPNRERRCHGNHREAIKNRIVEYYKNDVPNRNKSFKLHNNGIQIIYGNTRSYCSSYRKKQYLSNNAYTEEADLILISESDFVDGAQPYIEGYTQCGNKAKPIDKSNTNYYTGGVAAWKRQGPGPKVLYRDQFNQIKGFQALKLVMESNIAILCFYRSPNQTKEEIEETIEFFKKIPENTIIVGDLNIPETDWTVNEIPKKTGCKNRREKEDLVLQLTIENDRRQRVDFATNKFNNNILDVVIAPNDVKINKLKEVSSPDKGEDPGTDHKWLGFAIEREIRKEKGQDHEEAKTTVNYEYMNEILKKKGMEISRPSGRHTQRREMRHV